MATTALLVDWIRGIVTDQEKQAAIIETIHAPTYGHAENVIRRFLAYELKVGTAKAIDKIYTEVVLGEDDTVSTDGE